MYKILSILLIASFLLLSHSIVGQNEHRIGGKSMIELRKEKTQKPQLDFAMPIIERTILTNLPTTKSYPKNIFSVSKTYWEELGFFCKMELKVVQQSNFPIKFRLGTVDYVDRLEGKYD